MNMVYDDLKIFFVVLGIWVWGDIGEVGCGYFGSGFVWVDLEVMIDKVNVVGFWLWDIVMVYGMGCVEMLFGEVLKCVLCSDYQFVIKFMLQVVGSGDYLVVDMLEYSLVCFGMDYIDFYWIYNFGDVVWWILQLILLLKSGQVRYVGVLNYNFDEIQFVNCLFGEVGFWIEVVQNYYSLFYCGLECVGIFDYCCGQGILFFVYMVLE